jgi:hypothetical protein
MNKHFSERTKLYMCIKKKRYVNIDEANIAGLNQIKSHGQHQLYLYLCPICNGWHLTHKPNNRRVV